MDVSKEDIIKEIKNSLTEITNNNPDDLIRKELGEFNFENERSDIELFLGFYIEMEKIDLNILPNNILSSIKTESDMICQFINRIKEFSATKFPNPLQEKKK